MANPMPAIFFGHGNPMNAFDHNPWTEAWATIGKELPRPRAVLSVSAHWYLPATMVTAMPAPRTIHEREMATRSASRWRDSTEDQFRC